MKKPHSKLMLPIAVTALAMTSGCLGPKVLSENVAHVPAPDPRVELRLKTESPADILVIYDDLSTSSEKGTRRAFYLFANEGRISHGSRPLFVRLSEANHLDKIPVLQEQPTNANPHELYAIAMTSRQFKLESRDHILTEFTLPEYEDWLTAKKLFLFPAAVAADAVGVGVATAVYNPGLAADAANAAVRAAH